MKYHDSHPYEGEPGRLQKTGRKQAPEMQFPAGCFFILAWIADMCKELAEKNRFREEEKCMILHGRSGRRSSIISLPGPDV